MKNLENIPKKNVFEVPDGYFDRLPGIIQARVADEKRESFWTVSVRYSVRFALPALALVVVAFFFWSRPSGQSTEDMLASVDSISLVAYLEDSDISSDDLLESVSLQTDEADAIQENSMDEIQAADLDLKELGDEFGVDYF
ncbi:MAG TPA: hypothetical protein PLR06_08770 [Cyclobacteriaceae bacterium]|nr:hypothetical protein [Cyclobacteriaceae bacterium]